MKKAFTLAEILITLSIIGVIASMTIPSLVQDVQDAQLKTAWKKAYADLEQTTRRLVADNSGSLKGLFSDYNVSNNSFAKYFNYTKYCDNSGNTLGNCWHLNNKFKYLNGSPAGGWGTGHAGLILNNGSLFVVKHIYSDCTGYSANACAALEIDINGFKGPNTYGKDIFQVLILKNSIRPSGFQGGPSDPSTTCIENNINSTNSGYGCSAKYLYQ